MNKWILVVAGVALLAGTIAVAAVLLTPSPGQPDLGRDAADQTGELSMGYEQLIAQLESEGVDVMTDTDGDGLPDAVENFIYGSDPNAFSTTENGIPDGWFAQYGYDPTLPGVEQLPAAIPPPEAMPEVYQGEWPDRYRWTLADAYFHGMPADWPDETYFDNGIDPNRWQATPDGLPTAWLVHHFGDEEIDEDGNLEILEAGIPERSLTDDGFTVRDNYVHDTDPRLVDTDGDGLSDRDEVERYGTDPRRFSTSGTGVPDGWIVGHELDPLDPMVGSMDPTGKGMNVSQVWQYNLERFGLEEALQGEGLDPGEMSHRGDAVPDGWLVKHDLDPMEAGITQDEYQCASDYDDVRHLPGMDDIPEGMEPIPDLCLIVLDAYTYGRPQDWDEADNGPWPGGLDPAEGDQDGDGLPDAVEIRGWYVERTVDIGPGVTGEWVHVRSNPLRVDTDADGLTDHEEYHGRAERDNVTYVFSPTDPSNPDTAFSGMTDAEKVFAVYAGESWDLHKEQTDGSLRPLLDPTRRDTAGDFLADGQAMDYWIQAQKNVQQQKPYNQVHPGSLHETYTGWMSELGLIDGLDDWDGAARLMGPDGNLDGDLDDDGDPIPNVVDPSASGDGLLNGWQVNPSTLRFSDFPAPTTDRPRPSTDPANPDTSGDRLPDAWKLSYGRWDPTIQGGEGGWDLDPAKADSSGDGVLDGQGNLNNDVVEWHAYDGNVVVINSWEYTNMKEFRAGTNPRVLDEHNRNVTEGWVAFWGEVYPCWLDARDNPETTNCSEDPQDLGDVVPDPGTTAFEETQHRILDTQNRVGNAVKDETEYVRFITLATDQQDSTFLIRANSERYVDGWPQEIQVADGDPTFIAMIEGTFRLTHANDQERGLNPYLKDTDGDLMPDAWEVYHYSQDICTEGPNPVRPDAHQDPDGDGLTNLEEYELHEIYGVGTHPCMEDTDLDGIDDATEHFLPGRAPIAPMNAGEGGGDEDTSGTGITDQQEVNRGLDPRDPDTDRDGLLDGIGARPNNNRGHLELSNDFEDHERFIQWFKALGIVHVVGQAADNHCETDMDVPLADRICFIGESDSDASRNPYSDNPGSGVPDGWANHHNVIPASADEAVRSAYECGKPPWWEREKLGVWWWGVSPQDADDCPRDRDLDGLDDHNGEDPVPAASQSNRGVPRIEGLLEGHEGADLQDLLAAPLDNPLERVMAAQSWGECAGNPRPCFTQWSQNTGNLPERLPVIIANVHVTGLDDGTIPKQAPFQVQGALDLDDCQGDCGVASRTVVLRLWDQGNSEAYQYDIHSSDFQQNGVTLGVNFTNADGTFEIDACLCDQDGSIEVPPGFVALGRTNTTATWDRFADRIPAGSPWELGIHVYPSIATFWGDPEKDEETHPHYLEDDDGNPVATQRLWEPIGSRSVTSTTTLTISDDFPSRFAWSDGDRTLPVTVHLADASGGGVNQANVIVEATNGSDTLTDTANTNHQGDATIALPLGEHTGSWTVTASYPGDPDRGLTGADGESAAVILQSPLELTASEETQTVRIGEPSQFTVTARDHHDQPAANANITASLGPASHFAMTDPNGVATLTLTPTDMEPGVTEVTFRASTTAQYVAATAAQPVRLVSGSLLNAQVPEEGTLGGPLAIEGRLTLSDGTPLAGQNVNVTFAGNPMAERTTDETGRFHATPIVPLEVGIGSQTLRIEYDGTDVIDAANLEKTVRFSVGTRIALDEQHAGRGQVLHLEGRLTSITGHPLVGERVTLTLPWDEEESLLARSGGAFQATYQVPPDHPVGVFPINASYPGSTNGTFGSVNISVPLTIGAPSHLETEPLGVIHRGNTALVARLFDNETGDPIANAPVRIDSPFHDEAETARTNENGNAAFALDIDRHADPGAFTVTFRFEGDERYAPAETETHGVLRVPSRLVASMPAELGRGTSHAFEAVLLDDRGEPLTQRTLTFNAVGTSWNETTDNKGRVTTPFELPQQAPLGEARASVAWDGDEAHEPTRVDRTVVVKDGVHVHVDGVPDEVRPGDRITIRLHVEDTAGNPVQTTLVIRVDGMPGSLLIETDPAGQAETTITVPELQTESLRMSVRFPGTENLAARTDTFEPRLMTATLGDPVEEKGPWWIATGSAIALIATAGIAAYIVIRKRKNAITHILEESNRRIEAGDPWTGAVLLAYRQLVEHLEDHGVEDPETSTPRTFAQHLVNIGFMEEEAAAALVSLFERARYADDGELSQEDAIEARQILSETIQSAKRNESIRERSTQT